MSDKLVYNCHTHCFNAPCVPDGFLSNYVPGQIGKFLPGLLRNKPSRKVIQFLVGLTQKYKRFKGFIRVATYREQEQIFEEAYKAIGNNGRVIVLALNFDFMGGGKLPSNYETQLVGVKETLQRNKDACLPFYCADPRRGTAQENLDDLKRYFDITRPSGFVGIKLYPGLGFYPFDPRLEKIYEFAQTHNIPITSHCTTGGAYYVPDPIPAAMMEPVSFNGTNASRSYHVYNSYEPKRINSKNKDKFNHPVNYYDVLEAFPDLKINIAHYGGDDMIEAYLKDPAKANVFDNWYLCIRNMISGVVPRDKNGLVLIEQPKTYTRLYTDISFSLHNNASVSGPGGKVTIGDQIRTDIKTPGLGDKMLYGTDYFMTVQYEEEKELYEKFRKETPDVLFYKIAYDNPRAFLSSDIYMPR